MMIVRNGQAERYDMTTAGRDTDLGKSVLGTIFFLAKAKNEWVG